MVMNADHGGHVPDELIYGPVTSRRFGRSLGISCSWPGGRFCRWGCPYCQLGHLGDDPACGTVSLEDLRTATTRALAGLRPGSIDVITLAGGGEPTEHPDFAPYISWLVDELARWGGAARPRLILLSNGDGLDDPAVVAAVRRIDASYFKWDPGAEQGCWAPSARRRVTDRRTLLAGLDALRIQALLFARRDGRPGNADAAAQRAWLADMRALQPCEIQLTTIERPPCDSALVAVDDATLAAWRAAAAEIVAAHDDEAGG